MNQQLFDEMARKGANIHLANLTQEIEEIYATFPDLRTANGTNGAVFNSATVTETVPRAGRTGKGRRFSPAQRRAQSERMKAMWAKKRRNK